MSPPASVADVLADDPLGPVLEAMEVIASVCLERLFPDDRGALVLESLGLLAARQAAMQVAGGPEGDSRRFPPSTPGTAQ
jgi:hypothetical protein